jgi:Putative DNA-binding domain
MTGAAPTSTLLGASVAEVTAQDIARLINEQVKETDELEFKATLYGRSEDAKTELCKDIAGLRNHRGGAILLGVGEKDAVANGCPDVELSDAEERRMRQIVAGGTAPHAAFDIRAVPGDEAGRGFYLLLAESSPLRPHAVLVGDSLRFPRRDGTTTRYLTEAEVADMYRDRFHGEKQQIERLTQIADETIPMLDTDDDRAWLVVSLVPNSPGDLPISFDGLREIEAWAHTPHASNELLEAFFADYPQSLALVSSATCSPHLQTSANAHGTRMRFASPTAPRQPRSKCGKARAGRR